jgi:hypothetical protein
MHIPKRKGRKKHGTLHLRDHLHPAGRPADETQQYTDEGFARECFRLFDEPDSAEMYSRIRLTRHDWETGTDEVLETLEF